MRGGAQRFRNFAAAFLVALLAPALAFGHGTWFGLPRLELSPATIALVDANVLNGDGPVLPGDVVEIVAAIDTIADGTPSGAGGYITFYVPAGTRVVGASYVDASLNPIPVKAANGGVSAAGMPKGWGASGANTFNTTANGWNPQPLPSQCATYGRTRANCMAGLAFLYGDTGVFYSTRADTALYTGDGTLVAKYTNGYRVHPSYGDAWTDIGGTGDARVHNKWDAVQSNAFGSDAPICNPGFTTAECTALGRASGFFPSVRSQTGYGLGPTPFRAGSPVAGPDAASPMDRYGATGPWRRISYPGSCIATSTSSGAPNNPANDRYSVYGGTTTPQSAVICTQTSAGFSLSAANPLPAATNAVRFAIGGTRVGQTHRVMVRLEILDPTLINVFNVTGSGADATEESSFKGYDNMWRYWVGAPANIAISGQGFRLHLDKEIVAINGVPYEDGMTVSEDGTIRYRISYANTGAFMQTNVVLSDVLPTQTASTSNFEVIRGPDILPTTDPTGGTFSFLTIPALPGLTGGAVEFDVTLNAADGDTITNEARLQSAELGPLSDTVELTVDTPFGNVSVLKSVEVYDPDGEGLFAIPGRDVIYTIEVTNLGDATDESSIVVLDPIPPELIFYRGAFDGVTTEPVKFVEGGTPSGLTCCDSAHISYSTDGVSYSYLSPADYDPAITHLKVTPTGSMPAGGTSFSIKFRAKIR